VVVTKVGTHAASPVWVGDDLGELGRVKIVAHERAHIALGLLDAVCAGPCGGIEVRPCRWPTWS
jgi:hypothetical protein